MIEPVEILFSVEQDASFCPPVSEESIWCLPLSPGAFVVDNIPFYARDVSIEDEISADDLNGKLHFSKLLRPSKNTTIRVFATKPSAGEMIVPIMQSFGGLTEKMENSTLVAVSFPPSADLASALAYLDGESEAGRMAFEESAVRYR